MPTEEVSVEELRARVKALDSPLDNPRDNPPDNQLENRIEPAAEAPSTRDLTHKEDKSPSMWRVLLQLRVLLPYLSRLVPLLDGSAAQVTAQTHEFQHGLTEVQSGHRELRVQLQDQTVQLKRVEEQLERLRETTERNTLEQQELIEDLKSFAGSIKALAALGFVLLLANGGLVIYLLLRLRH